MKKDILLVIVIVAIGALIVAVGTYEFYEHYAKKEIMILNVIDFDVAEDGDLFIFVDGTEVYHDSGLQAGTHYDQIHPSMYGVPRNTQTITAEIVLYDKTGLETYRSAKEVDISNSLAFFVYWYPDDNSQPLT